LKLDEIFVVRRRIEHEKQKREKAEKELKDMLEKQKRLVP
jgi:hypothetical protein